MRYILLIIFLLFSINLFAGPDFKWFDMIGTDDSYCSTHTNYSWIQPVCSAIIPGLGQIMQHRVLTGLRILGFESIFAWGIIDDWKMLNSQASDGNSNDGFREVYVLYQFLGLYLIIFLI